MRRLLFASFAGLLLPPGAVADSPRVAVDIVPVHSLVAQVMSGVGEPDLIIRSGASPHGYSLRPSEAEALSNADVVFWIGEELTLWLENSLENLAGSARKVALLEVPGTTRHAFREGATFEAHDDHHDEQGHHDELAHEDEHGHDDEHAHEDGHDDHADEHGHQHGERDPHAWLDPENARVWIRVIAGTLTEVDSANAASYERNADAAVARLVDLEASIRARTDKLHDIRFIVFHDAYQYFERRFDVQAVGAISLGDASDPSPARVAEIRDTVAELGIRCVFTEPQFNPEMMRSVFENTGVTTIGVMDPLGADLDPGESHYTELLEALASSLDECRN